MHDPVEKVALNLLKTFNKLIYQMNDVFMNTRLIF